MLFSTVTIRRASDPARWARLTLGLRDTAPGSPFIEYVPGFQLRITPADPKAQSHADANWKSGILSGLGYAWRRWSDPSRGILVMELAGHLGHGDMEGIATAASIAVRELLGQADEPSKSDWTADTSAPFSALRESVPPVPIPSA
jgi:hypothetical protein